jgi:inhibitor of KinA sporulation pathway (predicted exonuclease)
MGGCILELPTGRIAQVCNADIRPERANVSRYCTKLTGITSARAASGIAFATAVGMLNDRFGKCDSWASFGAMDQVRLADQCAREGLSFPLPREHIDIRALAQAHFGWRIRKSLMQVISAIGCGFEGQRHTALADAKNAAIALRYLLIR